jgi:hypothetical protein
LLPPQVDKTYTDDSGFMVTKKEMVSASESDDQEEQEQKVRREILSQLPNTKAVQ